MTRYDDLRLKQAAEQRAKALESGLGYLASPYGTDPALAAKRMDTFCQVDAALMEAGVNTVSPLFKHFTFDHLKNKDVTWSRWTGHCRRVMIACDFLIITAMDGWSTSTGVTGEFDMARGLSLPVYKVDPNNLEGSIEQLIRSWVHDWEQREITRSCWP